MHTHPTRTVGSALLESILGIALLGLFLVILTGSVVHLNQEALHKRMHAEALLLAGEGLEAAQSIRDRDFALLLDGVHGLTDVSGVWEFEGSGNDGDTHVRTVTVLHEDAATVRISSTVVWSERARAHEITLETYLTDWKQ